MPADRDDGSAGLCPYLEVLDGLSDDPVRDGEGMDGDPQVGQRRERNLHALLVGIDDGAGQDVAEPAGLDRRHLGSARGLAPFLERIHLDGVGLGEEDRDGISLIGLYFVFCAHARKIEGSQHHTRQLKICPEIHYDSTAKIPPAAGKKEKRGFSGLRGREARCEEGYS